MKKKNLLNPHSTPLFFNILKHKSAFTLIELLVVVLIIGILAAIALPQYQKAVERSRITEARIMLKSILSANERYFLENGKYTSNLEEMDIDVPGTDTSSDPNLNRKATKYFTYGATANYWKAVAQRMPAGQKYALMYKVSDDNNTLYCCPFNEDENKSCLSAGGVSVEKSLCGSGVGCISCYEIK
ncbi:prepilin-type N-terminal cleavage/methylation domain-containing protein [Elusimicrobium posterum]|uniref:type IV pilin protein n=1 Tax=Elusimicrobium posterum TaxID=3116653 RepID=UPI003C7587B9